MSEESDAKEGGATVVTDRPAFHRFEAALNGRRVGLAEYRLEGERITFTHTETDPSFQGRGIAGHLIGEALEDVRRRGLTVVPLCEFVAAFIEDHPEYQDLVRTPG